MINSPQVNSTMVPPQACPYPMWPLSLVCHLWPGLPSTPFTLDAGIRLASEDQIYPCFSCGPNWNNQHRKRSLCWRPWDIQYRFFFGLLKHIDPWPRYQDFCFVHVDPKSLSSHVSLLEDQLLLRFLQRFRDDDQVICIQVFPGTFCWKILGKGFQNHD